jgi:ATP-dependent DNA helicase RecG
VDNVQQRGSLFEDPDAVERFRSAREDQWLERKSARVEPRALAETLVALANAEGGTIVVGIHDGAIEGVGAKAQNELRQAGRDFTDPPVRHAFRLIPCETAQGGAGEIAVLEVEASDHVHRTRGGDVFLRVGDENRRLRELEALELEYDKGQSGFDGRPVPGASASDLSERLVDEYLRRLAPIAEPQDALVARGLLAIRNGTPAPTAAGILLLSEIPQIWFPEAWVRVLVYRGRTRELGSRANIVVDKRFDGTLVAQIEGAAADLRERIPAAIRLGRSGRFEPAEIIPEHAWLEALVNAVLHRSYSMAGDHIRVELFDDRLEVESPGRLPGLVRVENIRSARFARNPRIARGLADLGYGRELGEGVDRMFAAMEEAGLPAPFYEQRPASVRVRLTANAAVAPAVRGLSARLAALYNAVGEAKALRTSDAMRLLGQSRPAALRGLMELQALGLIEHVGGLNDPRRYWRLREQATEDFHVL